MGIRDISVKKRLLFANFMMVCVPVCLLVLLGAVVLMGLRFTGPAQQAELAMLWPEKGPALSVQFAVSSLRVKAEKKGGPKLKDMQEDFRILEAQGIHTMVLQEDQLLYVTPGAERTLLEKKVRERCGLRQSMMAWDDDGFVFCYTSSRNQTTILSYGSVPFLSSDMAPQENTREFLEILLVLVLGAAIAVIVALGIYLSRLLSRQILEPLEDLRYAALQIRSGNLEEPLEVRSHDELGDTCRVFDSMRLELREAKNLQEKYEQNRKELIAGISHDLSTPLTSIRGYASGLLEGIARTPEKQKHYLEMIHHTTCSMERLVESLFLFSKLDLGRIPFHMELVDLTAYFSDYTAENYESFAERGLEIEFQPVDEAALVKLDRLQFQRVVENLLENSLKYRSMEKVHAGIALIREGNNWKLSFDDDGRGVAAEELPKLFESFYRTDRARTDVAKGSGLGLAIVKQIITGMRGEIWAEKAGTGGLKICMEFPAAEEN